ncbi:MAG: CarD family transcriptional regulator [Defluviitaleaceae bacterium]|nr:CarD family transcriptional regulator [Defluviitaleaceae bacterium]
MYSKGEAVVYPMHGAGIIEDVEEKHIDGVSRNYYVLRIPLGDLKILLCQENIESSNLRKVMPQDEIGRIMSNIDAAPSCLHTASWNQRYKENMEKIKTGKLCETAAVFHELFHREKQKGLSGAEKKVLTTAKKALLSEIMLSYNIEKLSAEQMLESYM